MSPQEALIHADTILKMARCDKDSPGKLFFQDFDRYAKLVGYCATQLTENQKDSIPWLKDWALAWRKMYDNWSDMVRADPMLLYKPKHDVSYKFHVSMAFVRYYMAGNGTSKTQSGYSEHYYVTTNQHRWRHVPPGAHSTFIVGLEFTHYAEAVFVKKFLEKEEGNPLSPIFPEGGKWLHSYNKKEHTICVACTECAEKGKAGSCRHPKSTIKLFSDKGSWEQLQGAQYIMGHFDEHVDEGWYNEGRERLNRVEKSLGGPYTSLMVTGTPLFGTTAWEVTKLLNRANGSPIDNKRRPSDPDSAPYVEVFNIDQFSAGIVDHDTIRAKMKDMDSWEIEARVYGRPAPLTKNPVFDRKRLDAMVKAAVAPKHTVLVAKKPLLDVANTQDIEPTEAVGVASNWTGWRVWEPPKKDAQYVASVDSAKGLIDGDASCCSILKIENKDMRLHVTLVAQFHGWINTFEYGDEVFKGAVWYNDALVVVELTGGYGEAVMLRLKKQLYYWNLFRGEPKQSTANLQLDARYGVDTTVASKPFMIAALQQAIKDGTLHIQCRQTIEELANFEQVKVTSDGKALQNVRYAAAGGALDDRVMSLAIGVGTAYSYPLFDFGQDVTTKDKYVPAPLEDDEEGFARRTNDTEIEPFDYDGGDSW